MVSEENIKRLEELIENANIEDADMNNCFGGEHIEAIENLLQGYKEWKEERELIGIPVKNKINGKIGIVLHQWKSGSVAVLENVSPRVINTHDSWNTLEIITDTVVSQTTKDDSIPKSLVEEYLKEAKEEYNKNVNEVYKNPTEALIDFQRTVGKKSVLEELQKEIKNRYKYREEGD